MVQITVEEKEVLAQWVPWADLSRVKIRTGPRVDRVCSFLSAGAITIGHSVFAASNSWIMRYPPAHPVRLALLAHELFHVKQEKRMGLPLYLIIYVFVFILLCMFAAVVKYRINSITRARLSHFNAHHNPFEKPAYRLQAEFLETYWTDEEAEKWKGIEAI